VRRTREKPGRAAAACVVGALALTATSVAAAQTADDPATTRAPRQLLAVVHAHSAASSGDQTLTALARQARDNNVEALVLSENYAYRFRYAPLVLRLFFEPVVSTPTLEDYGVERYLEELRRARADEPDVLLLAGVEVPPYYYWTGSLLTDDLTLHDMQRNVLIVPPVDGEQGTEEFLRSLPVVGNRHHRHYGIGSLTLFLPGMLLVVLSLRRLGRRASRPSRARSLSLLGLLLVGACLLWTNFPYKVASLSPYDTAAGDQPAQQLFDHVARNGGLSFWSMPEARDEREHAIGPVSVRLSTRPYPGALTDTHGFTGFGGVYADTVAAWAPGNVWDAALLEFLRRQRDAAPWLIGESAFHYAGHAEKQIDDILTVLLVEEEGPAAVLDALAEGRAYALRREPEGPDLRLPEFALIAAETADPAVDSRAPRTGRIGDTLLLHRGAEPSFDLVLQVDDDAGSEVAVRVDVVRNGRLHHRVEGTTPLHERWSELLAENEEAAFYRVVVRGPRPAHVVSNPIFVRRGARTSATSARR
jgi:hypothetical protein